MASTDPGPGYQLGDVAVPATVSPIATTPVVRASDLLGSHRTVDTILERDSINAVYRDEGMTVWVTSTNELYRLVGGIANSDWVLETSVTAGEVTFALNYAVGVAVRDVVYLSSADTVDRADASALATMPAFGVVAALDFPAAGQALVKRIGTVTGFAGLSANDIYVQSTTPGTILPEGSGDPAFPSVAGEVIQSIGQAINATDLAVDCSSMPLEL